jgi:hypothetical protein
MKDSRIGMIIRTGCKTLIYWRQLGGASSCSMTVKVFEVWLGQQDLFFALINSLNKGGANESEN